MRRDFAANWAAAAAKHILTILDRPQGAAFCRLGLAVAMAAGVALAGAQAASAQGYGQGYGYGFPGAPLVGPYGNPRIELRTVPVLPDHGPAQRPDGALYSQYGDQGGYGGGYDSRPRPHHRPSAVRRDAPAAAARRVSGAPPAGERRLVPDEVVIEVDGRPTTADADALARRHGLTRVESQEFQLTNSTMFRWRIPDGRSVATVVRQLEADGNVRSAQPNYTYRVQQRARSEGDPGQYALAKLNLVAAHDIAKGDNVLVAVIDSGVDVTHPELAGVIAATFDAVDPGGPPHPHGTGIAGIIAAGARLMGVAPAARIIAIRAFSPSADSAEGTSFNVLKAMEFAMDHGAAVINMSFTGPQQDPVIHRALQTARGKGIVLIAAAGNAGPKSPPLFPASDPNVIAVTATDSEDQLFPAANRGSFIAIAAPGVDILAPSPAGYQIQSGTSFAAAHVTGIVALMLQRNPTLTPDAVRHALTISARKLAGKTTMFGAGLADALAALNAAARGKSAIETATSGGPR